MPESQIILSQAVTYMACAPKSNAAVNAIFAAMDSVKHTQTTVPVHLQDAHYGGHENSARESATNMPTIIQITMSNSNIFLQRLKVLISMNQVILATKKR